MRQHYKRDTVEIAERFKFLKHVQQDREGVAEYVAELRKLGKTGSFGAYLDTALRDQLVCGLRDQKTQKELLCMQDLMLATAIEKARAADTVNREILHFPMEADTLKLYNQLQQRPCHRCGQYGHTGATCIHKNKRCNVCKKVRQLIVQYVGMHNSKSPPNSLFCGNISIIL